MKHRIVHRYLVLLLLVLLAGCGSTRCPRLPGAVSYCLQPPAAGPGMTVLQHVSIVTPERQETLLVRIENNADRLALVGLSPLGQTLLTLTWDGTDVTDTETPGGHPPIRPGALVAVLQLALWPRESVQAGLPHDVTWLENDMGAAMIRNGTTLLSIHRSGAAPPYSNLHIDMPSAALSLHIQSLPEQDSVR